LTDLIANYLNDIDALKDANKKLEKSNADLKKEVESAKDNETTENTLKELEDKVHALEEENNNMNARYSQLLQKYNEIT